ncbi:uncharacterized protein I303_104815 [Kwoniella dejecticola CBS 10117]|uniref:CID domain-containing protein n=1 Tax=Kwoniella dejecticola CBS 10117 TaxID=1296121 RepID=A0A1A6A496_9TREE|nr:uncharacterized protein I303_04204 [Kwoniella dejecticola CBS 10117]OBR84882.1 hypothetical protein I303_04204 [Kwoniella dejecticola CBS 10117]
MSSSSFDPFEARMQFLNLIRKLNASQQSIQKVVVYAIKYGSKCGEDLWECIIEQCGKGSLNTRINILYFLDTLLEVSLPLDHTEAPYPELVTKNLLSIVEKVVPDNRDGILNLRSAKQILESWRLRRVIDHDVVEEAIQSLDGRTYGGTDDSSKRTHEQAFSRTEILRRMEEDRERHKRLRERIWILPIPPLHPPNTSAQTQAQAQGKIKSSPSTTSPFTPASPSSNPWPSTSTAHSTPGKMAPPPPPLPSSAQDKADVEMDSARTAHSGDVVGIESALDMEFEQAWEGISEIDEEELTKMRE